jgi:hypothetical protein
VTYTVNYKGFTVYRDLQNARNKQTEINILQVNKPSHKIPHTHNKLSARYKTKIAYSQVLNRNNLNNQTDDNGVQLNTFLNEFKTIFTQLINQNSMILTMLSTVINNKLNNGR